MVKGLKMPFLNSGSFLRLYGLAADGTKVAMEVQIKDVTIAAPVVTAVAALAAAQYGTGKPSILSYIGNEIIIGQDQGSNPALRAGDARNNWRMSFASGGLRPDIVGIPTRDNVDASLIQPGTEDEAALSTTPWTTWLAKMQDPNLLAPFNGTGAAALQGGVASVFRRVRPREVVRALPTPLVVGGTRLNLWGLDVAGRKAFSQFGILSIVLPSALVTAINALGAATYNSVPGTGPITPALGLYTGFEVIVRTDAGFTGGGSGDVRDKWRVTAKSTTELSRFTIPGRNSDTASLYLPGTKTIANFLTGAWATWVTKMVDPNLLAPTDDDGLQAILIGARATVRHQKAPRESVLV